MSITKKRKKYSTEFKEEAIKLVTEQGYPVTEAARNLDIHPHLLGKWKREAENVEKQGFLAAKKRRSAGGVETSAFGE